MKPGKNDKQAQILFEMDELDLLKENTWQMAESFGLDRRIDKLTGKRKIGLYYWDLECLMEAVEDLEEPEANKEVLERLIRKLRESYELVRIRD